MQSDAGEAASYRSPKIPKLDLHQTNGDPESDDKFNDHEG